MKESITDYVLIKALCMCELEKTPRLYDRTVAGHCQHWTPGARIHSHDQMMCESIAIIEQANETFIMVKEQDGV